MATPAQFSSYIQFIQEYLIDSVQATPEKITAELRGLSALVQKWVLNAVDSAEKLDSDISSQREDLQSDRLQLCHEWESLDQATQTTAANGIRTRWQQLLQNCRERIRILNQCTFATKGESADILQTSLKERVQANQAERTELLEFRDLLGDLSADAPPTTTPLNPTTTTSYKQWKPDQKIWPEPGTEVYKLCQKQVLPPPPTTQSESPQTSNFRKKIDLQRFIKSKGKGATWQSQTLPSGAQGSAWAYTLTDTNGVILNRLVRKETGQSETLEDWSCPYSWHGDTSLPNWRNECVPLEFHTQNLISTPKTSHTVKLLAPPQVFWEEWKYRLYMEFAPNGDLDQLIDLHDGYREPVPETFCWLVLRALVETCLVMERGDGVGSKKKGGGGGEGEEWSEIVHCDFKAGNVFLGVPDRKFYPQYPTIKLGDFGLAFVTNDQDETNPIWWSDRGTEGHFAPEQLHYVDSVTKESMGNTKKILSSANIYGLATIIYQLLERKNFIGEQPTWESTEPLPVGTTTSEIPNPEFKVSDETRRLYDDAKLIDLIEECFAFEPANRPSLERLLENCNARLKGRKAKAERDGMVDERGDSLLIPGEIVNLKWTSRLEGEGLDSRGERIPRREDEDQEMEMEMEMEDDDGDGEVEEDSEDEEMDDDVEMEDD